MNDTVIAFLSLLGTFVGTFGGILTSSKLTSYRIEQLEKKVDKLASIVDRVPILEAQQGNDERRIQELENSVNAK